MSGRFAVRFCSLSVVLTVVALLPAVAPAQEESASQPRYGRVAVDETRPYCWPSAVVAPPRFEDTLEKDQVVRVGRTEGTFVQVALPLGPVGYVSKRFAVADEDGVVRTKGSKVAFRYRTVTTEAPVTQLPDGTELFVVGEQDDWWRVRLPSVEAWLPRTEVTIGDPDDAALASAYAESKAAYEAEVDARLEAIAAAKQRAEQDRADAAAVQMVQDAFQKELEKPVSEQQFDGLGTALDKVETTLAEDSSAKALVASLRKRIQAQQWIVEATALKNEKPVPANEPVLAPQPKDELERFHSIGWLRYESRLGGAGIFYLEKGGLRLHHVTCSTGRYDLALFTDCEIGIQGPRRRPATAAFSVLDVERLEVLGHNRR